MSRKIPIPWRGAVREFFLTIREMPWTTVYRGFIPVTVTILFAFGAVAAWLVGIQVASWFIPQGTDLTHATQFIEFTAATGFFLLAVGYGWFTSRIVPPGRET